VTRYMIVPHVGGDTFDVKIVCADGGRQTLLGFATLGAAEAWIARDKVRGYREDRNRKAAARFDSQVTNWAVHVPKAGYP
jgi:hypothetical protein